MTMKKHYILLAHAFAGWVLCAATMGIGMNTISMDSTLIIHAIGAPIFFAIVSLIYFSKFNYTTPLLTAVYFISFVVLVDVFVVALMINQSLEMFTSLIGTWIPFSLIFISTFFTGIIVSKRNHEIKSSN